MIVVTHDNWDFFFNVIKCYIPIIWEDDRLLSKRWLPACTHYIILCKICITTSMYVHMWYKRKYILDGYKYWFHLGRCNCVCLFFWMCVNSLMIRKKNLSQVFPALLWPKECSNRHHLFPDLFIAWVNLAKESLKHLPSLLLTISFYLDSLPQCTGAQTSVHTHT